MSVVERTQQIEALKCKARLMNPPNAVDDTGINLREKPQPKPRIPIPLKLGPIVPYRIPRHNPAPEDVTRIVCEHFNVSTTDLEGKLRTQALVKPRQIWAYFAYQVSKISYPQIGRYLGGRDHSTQIHAVRKVESNIEADKEFSVEIELLRYQLERLFSIRSAINCIDPREF
jgi:hypothetical protein